MIPSWLIIFGLCLISLILYRYISSNTESFVVAAPMPDDYHIQASKDLENTTLHSAKYPPKDEILRNASTRNLKGWVDGDPGYPMDIEKWKGIGFDNIPAGIGEKPFAQNLDGAASPGSNPYIEEPKEECQSSSYPDNIKALKENVPTGHPYRRQEHIGYRWKESWRPYYWRNYPNPPIWFPARDPAAGAPQLPPDIILQKMEEDPQNSGVSPEGYRYFWRVDPPYQPLCADFADKACRNQSLSLLLF